MAIKAVFVVCLCLLAVGEAGRQYNPPPPSRGGGGYGYGRNTGSNRGNLGSDCEYDDDCYMDNAFCHMQMQCKCKRNYEPNTSRDSCVARIGAECRSRFDCSSLENSECRQNICACQEGFIAHLEKTCLRLPARINDQCETDDQCRVLENSVCLDRRCQCGRNFHEADGKCFKDAGLNDSCNHDNDCYSGKEFQGSMKCQNGKCQCKQGYHETPDRKCAGGDSGSTLQFSISLLVVSILLSTSWGRQIIN